jgi:hypothetical protein
MHPNLKIRTNDGPDLAMTALGYCRLSALLDGLEIIADNIPAGHKVRWDLGGELVAYVTARGDDLYHGNR